MKNLNTLYIGMGIAIAATLVIGCATEKKKKTFEKDEVIERSSPDKPAWLNESSATAEAEGVYAFLGRFTGTPDQRLDALYEMCTHNARLALAESIQTTVSKTLEVSQQGLGYDDGSIRRFSQEVVDRVRVRGAPVRQRYHEKVVVSTLDGDRSLEVRVFCRIEVPKAAYRSLIVESARGSGSPDFAKWIEKQQDRFSPVMTQTASSTVKEAKATAPATEKQNEQEE